MGIIGGTLGYRILKWISKDGENDYCDGSAYLHKSKLETMLGAGIWDRIAGRTVIDFGCGEGAEAIEMAQKGAGYVVGLDLWRERIEAARRAAERAGVADRCNFATTTDAKADLIISLDSFEHFADPPDILRQMRRLIKDDGRLMLAFGCPWYHPFGGHQFSVFPWAHLIFTEKSLIHWRADFKTDGATRFCEVEGGLNEMSLRRMKKIIGESDFAIETFEPVPIRRLKRLHNRLTQEWITAVVRCTLIPRADLKSRTLTTEGKQQ